MEIERKFLIKEMPYLSQLEAVLYERHFLYFRDGIQMRIQHKDNIYELERKVTIDTLSAEKLKIEISQGEFEALKKFSIGTIIRESYKLNDSPNVTIKKYTAPIADFARVEVEFDSIEEAEAFVPPEWFGDEITGHLEASDAGLLELSDL